MNQSVAAEEIMLSFEVSPQMTLAIGKMTALNPKDAIPAALGVLIVNALACGMPRAALLATVAQLYDETADEMQRAALSGLGGGAA